MYVLRRQIRAAADLGNGELWTGPALKCSFALQVALWVRATNATAPAAFSWETSDDGSSWLVGAPPVGTLTQYDAITAQALNNAGGRKVVLIGNTQGGHTPCIPWNFVRAKITGGAAITTGFEVWATIAFLGKPIIVMDSGDILG